MNGLFGWALGEIGFSVSRLCGAVMRQALGDAVIGNHLVLRVDLDQPWIADVGFGDGPLEPFAAVEGGFRQRFFDFRLERQDAGWWRLHNHPHGGAPSYDMRLAVADERVLTERCAWLQTAPESNFVLNAVAQKHDAAGLWQLRGRVLRRVEASGVSEQLVADAGDYVRVGRDLRAQAARSIRSVAPDLRATRSAVRDCSARGRPTVRRRRGLARPTAAA